MGQALRGYWYGTVGFRGRKLPQGGSTVVILLGGQALGTSFIAILRNLTRATFSDDNRELSGSNALFNAQFRLETAKIRASEGPVLYAVEWVSVL